MFSPEAGPSQHGPHKVSFPFDDTNKCLCPMQKEKDETGSV